MLAMVTVSALEPWSICRVSPTVRPVVLARRIPVVPTVGAAPSVVAWVPHTGIGAFESIITLIERKGGVAVTATFAACAFASGADRTTFGAGDAGAGVGMLAIVTVSWAAPVSITRTSPTARPVVLVSRIAVAPAADA